MATPATPSLPPQFNSPADQLGPSTKSFESIKPTVKVAKSVFPGIAAGVVAGGITYGAIALATATLAISATGLGTVIIIAVVVMAIALIVLQLNIGPEKVTSDEVNQAKNAYLSTRTLADRTTYVAVLNARISYLEQLKEQEEVGVDPSSTEYTNMSGRIETYRDEIEKLYEARISSELEVIREPKTTPKVVETVKSPNVYAFNDEEDGGSMEINLEDS